MLKAVNTKTTGATMRHVWIGAALAVVGFGLAGCGGDSGGGGGTIQGTISQVDPPIGQESGNTTVTLQSNFSFGPGATVFFGDAQATVQSVAGNQVVVTSPSSAAAIGTDTDLSGVVDVVVTQNGTGSASFTLTEGYQYQNLSITSVSPDSIEADGITSTEITINGTGFVDITSVTIGGIALNPFEVVSPTRIVGTLLAPAVPDTVDVVVTSSSQVDPANGGLLSDGFDFEPQVGQVLISFANSTPQAGDPGTAITLNGANFPTNMADISVQVGGFDATITSLMANQIIITAPVGPAPGTTNLITITTTNRGSAGGPGGPFFVYNNTPTPPTITAIDPATGPESGGTRVLVTGSNFDENTTITVDGVPMTEVLFNIGDGTITGTIPPFSGAVLAGNTIAVDVIATNDSGDSAPVTFTYERSLNVTSLNPNDGPRSGGTTVTIVGRNFQDNGVDNVSGVQFGTVAGTIVSVTPTTIEVQTPALNSTIGSGADAVADITLVGANGFGSLTVPNAFTYGRLLDEPTFPLVDSLDTNGDIQGSQNFNNPQAGLDDIDFESRVFAGDILPSNVQAVAVTIPATDSVYYQHRRVNFTINADCTQEEDITVLSNQTLAVGLTPTSLVYTELEMELLGVDDPAPDFVVAGDDGSLAVVSDGAVQQTISLSVSPAVDVLTADFDDDGFFDIATVHEDGTIRFYQRDPMAGAASSVLTAAGMITVSGVTGNVVRAAVGDPGGADRLGYDDDDPLLDAIPLSLRFDLNRDQFPDIAVLSDDGLITYLLGAGDFMNFGLRQFSPGTGLTQALDMVLTDINRDNRLDLAVLTRNEIAVFRGAFNPVTNQAAIAQITTLSFPTGTTFNTNLEAFPSRPTGITVADATRNCFPDLVVSGFDGGGPNIAVYPNNGDERFSSPVLYIANVQANMRSANVGIDVAGQRNQGIWSLCVDTADSGRSALIEVDRNFIPLFIGEAPNVLTGPLTTQPDPRSIAIGDMNDDGRNDVVTVSFDGTIEVWLNDREGSFDSPLQFNSAAGPLAITLEDINRDRFLDVIISNELAGGAPSDQISIHFGNGAGGIGGVTTYSVFGRRPSAIAVQDLNDDNAPEIVTVNQVTNNVSIFMNLGDGTFDPIPQRFGVGNAPSGIDIGDVGTPEDMSILMSPRALGSLAPDGQPDIVVANSADDSVTVIYNDLAGSGTFGNQESYTISGFLNPDVFTVINDADFVTPQALGFFGFADRKVREIPDPVEPTDIMLLDVNNDGFLDILTVDQGTDTVTILHANSNAREFSPIQNLNGLGVNDLDADGLLDLTIAESMNRRVYDPNEAGALSLDQIGGVSAGPGFAIRKFFLPTDYRLQTLNNLSLVGSPQITLPTANSPEIIRRADMNADGLTDLVIGSSLGSAFRIYTRSGTDTQSGLGGPDGLIMPADANITPTDGFPNRVAHPPVHTSGEATFRAPVCPLNVGALPGYSPDSNVATFFSTNVGGQIRGMVVGRINDDCPPDVIVITANGNLTVFAGR